MFDMLNFLDINLFSIVMLSIIFVVTKIKKDVLSFSSSIFSWIIVLNISGLVFESLTWIVDGMSSEFAYVIGYVLNMILIMSGPALMGLWTSYVDYQLYSDKKRVHKFVFYQIPTIITALFLIVNLFVPIFFEIDRTTHLWRPASLMFIRYLLTYMLYLRVIYLVAINKHHSSHRIISGIMLFLTIPLLGIVIQMIYPTMLLSWSFLALTIIVVYIFLETVSGNHDYLTGVYSRRLMETYIRHKIEEMQDFHLVMTDMDYFKQVNDIYGHHVGDKVLIQFSKALQQSGHQKQTFVARLGGDEFITVIDYHPDFLPDYYIESVNRKMKEDAYLAQFKFLAFSAGVITFDRKMSLDDLLNKVDQKMYAEKEKRHQKAGYPGK